MGIVTSIMKARMVLGNRMGIFRVRYGIRNRRRLLREELVDNHTNFDRGIRLRELLLGVDDCCLEIVEFVSSEGFSIDVVFSLEYITSGKLREEIKIFKEATFLTEEVMKGDKSLRRWNPFRIRSNSGGQ